MKIDRINDESYLIHISAGELWWLESQLGFLLDDYPDDMNDMAENLLKLLNEHAWRVPNKFRRRDDDR